MKKKRLISVCLIVILVLAVLLCGLYAAFATSTVSEVRYSPNEEEFEVKVKLTEAGDAEISISVCSKDLPLSLVREISISKIRVQTSQKEYVLDGQHDERMLIEDGKGNMTIPIDAVPLSECQLIITELIGYAKGEGPLFITGRWTS